jgi:hypothetical protein
MCAAAPTIWALQDRFFDLLPVALWVQKITLSTVPKSLKESFLVKTKPFLSQLLLPVFVSCVRSAYAHFRRCGLALKATDILQILACCSVGLWNSSSHEWSLSTESKPIPISIISVLVLHIFPMRSKHSS